MSKLDRIDKIERNFNMDQYGTKESNNKVMKALTRNVSREDVKLSKNFKISILREAGILME